MTSNNVKQITLTTYSAQPAPFSGDYPLANWKGQELETYANLSEARGIGK